MFSCVNESIMHRTGRWMRGYTCSQEDDVKEHVFALHHIHGHVSEAHAVLHKVRDGVHRLDHLVHEQKPLSVLQVPLGQVHIGA